MCSYFSQGWDFASKNQVTIDTNRTLSIHKNNIKFETTFQCEQWVAGYIAKQKVLLSKNRISGK